MRMANGEDESEAKQRRAQDLIETVAPPRGKRSSGAAGDAPGPDATPDGESEDAFDEEAIQPGRPVSPDDIPTERPPWSDPVESRERPLPGVPIPPLKKNA